MNPHVISYLAGTADQRPRKKSALAADVALSICRAPATLALITALFADSAITKARHAAHDWQAARQAAAQARRESRAGEYPIVDRPLTFMERQARRRLDRDQG